MMETEDALDATQAKQGKVTGIIVPPPEIRAVVDKTSQFVAKNGKAFEQRILASEEGKTAKFNFMRPYDPYHAYYEFKIREFEEGTQAPDGKPKEQQEQHISPSNPQPESVKAPPQMATSSSVKSARSSLMSPVARFAMNKSTISPHNFEFSLGHPSGLADVDMDVIKLTAQFTAANGRQFLGELAQKEQRNPQFDFLKPTHLLFSYFTSLVDSYAKILQPSHDLLKRVESKCNKMKALETTVNRWEWTRAEDERKKRESAEADAERMAFQSIDWFEFTVVETIEFPEDELFDYPTMLDTSDFEKTRQTQQPQYAHRTLSSLGGPPGPPPRPTYQPMHVPPPQLKPPPPPTDDDVDMDMDMDDDDIQPQKITNRPLHEQDDEDDPDIKVVADYRPRMAPQAGSGPASGMTMLDPISGRVMPVDEIGEHMRVQLLDPRWRVEQQRFQDKQRDTGFAEGSSIMDNLKQFARQREDIFGQGSGAPASEVVTKKQETVQWDGHQSSIQAAQLQMRELSARQPQVQTPAVIPSSIGPSFPGITSSTNLSTPATTLTIPSQGPIPTVKPPSSSSQTFVAQSNATPAPTLAVPSITPVPMLAPAVMLAPISQTPFVGIAPGLGVPLAPPLALTPLLPVQVPVAVPGYVPMQGYVPGYAPGYAPGYNEEPSSKKAKADEETIPADEFAAQFSGPISLNIIVPHDTSPTGAGWGLNGQQLCLSIPVTATVKEVKEAIAGLLRQSTGATEVMAANKQQLKAPSAGFLKDANTLAAHNIGDNATLELSARSRGGKR